MSDPQQAFFVVADGMGGHRGGSVASSIAVETIDRFVRTSRTDAGITWPIGFDVRRSFEANQLHNAIELAHRRICAEGRQDPALDGMGSTVVSAIVNGARMSVANVGDSRLYLLRRQVLTQVSEDHSWAASMLRDGADPQTLAEHPMRHMLTQALGSDQTLDVSLREETLQDGDVILLCSDGLYGPLGDEAIGAVLGADRWSVQDQVDRLIDLANGAGGPDNITAIVARYEANGRRREPAIVTSWRARE